MIDVLLEIVQRLPFTTLTSINDELRRRLPNKPHVTAKTIARHLDLQLITVKIAGKDADVPFRRNTPETKQRRQEYAPWLTDLDVRHKIIYIDESGFNIYQRRTQGRRGRNINVIVALKAELGVIRYSASQDTLNHDRYQAFIDELIVNAAPMFADHVHIVDQFHIHTLPPYSLFLNPVEQANSCYKAAAGRQLVLPAIQEELADVADQRQAAGLTLEQWRSRILLRVTHEAMREVTQAKCANWCNRVNRYIPASMAHQDILG